MRKDEELIMQEISKYLATNNSNFIEIEEGKDPPYYYVKLNNRENKIPLEITRAELKIRNNIDIPICEFVEKIDKEYSSELPQGSSVLFNLYGPYSDFKGFKKRFIDIIKRYIKGEISLSRERFEEINGLNVKCCNSKESYIAALVNYNTGKLSYDIQEETDELLIESISIKDNKIKAVNGKKWLGIYNGFSLATCRNYKQAIKYNDISHSFTKIFVVSFCKEINKYKTECIYDVKK